MLSEGITAGPRLAEGLRRLRCSAEARSCRASYNPEVDFERLPGGAVIRQGLADLEAGLETEPALLVLIGSPRLSNLGIRIPASSPPRVEHRLYDLLARTDPDSAHSRYNALIRLLVSFERAAECAT